MYVMLLIRALVVALILYVLWLLFFGQDPRSGDDSDTLNSSDAPRTSQPPPTDEPSVTTTDTLVQCQQCGIYIAVGDAICYKDRYYCSKEHLNLDNQTP